MLLLARKVGESVFLVLEEEDGTEVELGEIVVTDINRGTVKIGFDCVKNLKIRRRDQKGEN